MDRPGIGRIVSGRPGQREGSLRLGVGSGGIPKSVQRFLARALLRFLIRTLGCLAALPHEELEIFQRAARCQLPSPGIQLCLIAVVAIGPGRPRSRAISLLLSCHDSPFIRSLRG